jgi:hypothetical protein
MRLFAYLALAVLIGILAVPGGSLYFESGGGVRCTNCHEMQPHFDVWHASSHRNIGCGKCHGDALTLDVDFHRINISRAISHAKGELPEQINLLSRQVTKTSDMCAACHRQEYAAWKSGGHSATYSRIFLDQKHNTKNMLMDDCLRCHGMYFEGGVGDLVTPVARTGPWRLKRSELAEVPSMPCLTCHAVHREGPVMTKPSTDGHLEGPRQEKVRPSLAFYDRRTQRHVPLADLSVPQIREGDRLVRMSPDQRQALCYQCHAPTAGLQVGSGDDRTGLGVHEGISCLACHSQHGQKTRASCTTCHPRMSNCGLDVEKMDTTFNSPASKHNIHWVKCADCHTRGVPRKPTTTLETKR